MSKLKILIVEDESILALELATSIKNHGYHEVHYISKAHLLAKTLQEKSINLIIMDINLNEGMDGIDLFRSLNPNALLIYLTAYIDEKTIAKAIQTDPLGYLTKPHNDSELFALLKLAEYKIENSNPQTNKLLIDLGEGYCFYMDEKKLFHHDVFLRLSQKETALLSLLVEAKGNVVTFKTIEDELWRDNTPSASSLRTLIYRLRGKFKHQFITTEVNHGVKLDYFDFC